MRFNLDTIDKLRYISIPTELFTNPKYAILDVMSKTIYGVLKSRMNLSKANSWVEDNGDIFFYMPIEELSKMLTTSKATISRKLQELENVGLLERQHLASSRCHRMYLHQVESQVQVDENESNEAIVAHTEARVTPVQLRVSSMQPIYNKEILEDNKSLNNNNMYTNIDIVNTNSDYVDVETSETNKDSFNVAHFLQKIGITTHTITAICKRYTVERIKEVIEIFKSQQNVRNCAGFIISALRSNYQKPIRKNMDIDVISQDMENESLCQYVPASRPVPNFESPALINSIKNTIEQLYQRRGSIFEPYQRWLEEHELMLDINSGKIVNA